MRVGTSQWTALHEIGMQKMADKNETSKWRLLSEFFAGKVNALWAVYTRQNSGFLCLFWHVSVNFLVQNFSNQFELLETKSGACQKFCAKFVSFLCQFCTKNQKNLNVRNSVQILCLFCAKFGAKNHKYTRNTEKWFRNCFTWQEFLAQFFSNSGPKSVRKWHRKQNFV